MPLFALGFSSALVLVWAGRALSRRPLLLASLVALLGWYWPVLEPDLQALLSEAAAAGLPSSR